jgi:hypothetical protein
LFDYPFFSGSCSEPEVSGQPYVPARVILHLPFYIDDVAGIAEKAVGHETRKGLEGALRSRERFG